MLPFSRQFTATAISYIPLLPWRWKMAAMEWYLRGAFYRPCHMDHMAPTGGACDKDYTGQPYAARSQSAVINSVSDHMLLALRLVLLSANAMPNTSAW